MANQTSSSTQQNAAKRSAADDIIEAKVKGAVDAYQRGQYRSIRAAATAYDAPYHRTRSRCQGHHSRGQNGGNSTARDEDVSDQASHPDLPRAAGRRNRRRRAPQHPPPTTTAEAILTVDGVTGPRKPHSSARPLLPGVPPDHPSTSDLLRQLLERLDKHEATIRTDTATLERSLIEQVSTHMAQQEARIGHLEREISDVMAGMTEQAREIKFLRLSMSDRFDTLRGDFRLLRKTLDNNLSN